MLVLGATSVRPKIRSALDLESCDWSSGIRYGPTQSSERSRCCVGFTFSLSSVNFKIYAQRFIHPYNFYCMSIGRRIPDICVIDDPAEGLELVLGYWAGCVKTGGQVPRLGPYGGSLRRALELKLKTFKSEQARTHLFRIDLCNPHSPTSFPSADCKLVVNG